MNKKILLVFFLAFHSSLINTTQLSPEQLKKIAYKIWENECNQSKEGLTSWKEGEDFASVGICHCIWAPKDKIISFTETFPNLLTFMQQHNQQIPSYLLSCKACPWKNRHDFYKDIHSERMQNLRDFLLQTIDLQILFLVERFEKEVPSLINQLPKKQQLSCQNNINLLTQTPEGWYIVLDYLNFKGEGTNPKERYKRTGWGLLQVLQYMKNSQSNPETIKEFVQAADFILKKRVDHASLQRQAIEKKWLPGWLNRIKTYTTFSI